MKADKFIERKVVKENGRTFEIIKNEIKSSDIIKDDFSWIYEKIFNSDWEYAQDYGFYQIEGDSFYYFKVDSVLGEFEYFKENYINDYGEDDWNEYMAETYKLMYNKLSKWTGWDINFCEYDGETLN